MLLTICHLFSLAHKLRVSTETDTWPFLHSLYPKLIIPCKVPCDTLSFVQSMTCGGLLFDYICPTSPEITFHTFVPENRLTTMLWSCPMSTMFSQVDADNFLSSQCLEGSLVVAYCVLDVSVLFLKKKRKKKKDQYKLWDRRTSVKLKLDLERKSQKAVSSWCSPPHVKYMLNKLWLSMRILNLSSKFVMLSRLPNNSSLVNQKFLRFLK